MTVWVSESQLAKGSWHIDRGYVEVARHITVDETQKEHTIVELEDPETICLKELRTGLCRVQKGHRGRCSTVAFYCDNCGISRRGKPYRTEFDVNNDPLVHFCYMCLVVNNPDPYARYY